MAKLTAIATTSSSSGSGRTLQVFVACSFELIDTVSFLSLLSKILIYILLCHFLTAAAAAVDANLICIVEVNRKSQGPVSVLK